MFLTVKAVFPLELLTAHELKFANLEIYILTVYSNYPALFPQQKEQVINSNAQICVCFLCPFKHVGQSMHVSRKPKIQHSSKKSANRGLNTERFPAMSRAL